MSLTSYLNQEEVKNKFRELIPKPKFNCQYSIKAKPNTKNYALIGTAFDYLFRFYLKRKHPQAKTQKWVAIIALSVLAQQMDIQILENKNSVYLSDYKFDVPNKEEILEFEDFKNYLATITTRHSLDYNSPIRIFNLSFKKISKAEKNYKQYLKTGDLTDGLLKSVLDLAKLDEIYRSGKLSRNLDNYNYQDLEDLKKLYQTIPKNNKKDKEVVLNPTFGRASQMVNGADCDFIIDDTLVDIKTTKYLSLKESYWQQLIGYLILADITNRFVIPEIKRTGIYYSRHGFLWTISADKIYNQQNYKQLKSWFKNYIS